ncbi:MAG: hypothetical protein ABIR46_01715 [Candidatus Saccharimonadales bacterium]
MNTPHVVDASNTSLPYYRSLLSAPKLSSLINVASATFLRAESFSLDITRPITAKGYIR